MYIISRNLSANPLGCECDTVKSLEDVALLGVSIKAKCGSPADVSRVTFDSTMVKEPTYYTNVGPKLFQCSEYICF